VTGRRKQNAMNRILTWHGQKAAERIAQAILATAAGPGDCARTLHVRIFSGMPKRARTLSRHAGSEQ